MNLVERLRKQYRETEWYQQGAAARFYTIGLPWERCFSMTVNFKPVSVGYFGFVAYIKNDFMDLYFPKRSLQKVANYYSKPNMIQTTEKRYRVWLRKAISLRKIIKKLHNLDFSKLNHEQLISKYRQFYQAYSAIWAECIFHDSFDACGLEILQKLINKHGTVLTGHQINLLTLPDRLSWLQRERSNLLKLAEASKNQTRRQVLGKLEKHAEEFYWIYNDYAVVKNLTAKDFFQQVQELRANPKRMKGEREALFEAVQIPTKRKALIKNLKIPKEIAEFCQTLSTIASWHDQRKSHNQMGNAILHKFLLEFSHRTKIKPKILAYLFSWELPEVLFWLKDKAKRLTQKRMKGVFVYGNPVEGTEIYGSAARSLSEVIIRLVANRKNITGQPAYHGVVKGKIKIVRSQHEFKKMKKGDILVAPNTRPEYVPIMRIAGAILSEEGGITSHSAIISRELKIPCIVGAQGAIAKLKDGDLVEVDANKGVVRKLR